MSKALREQKCFSPSTACAGQTSRPVQRRTTSRLAGLLVDLAQRRRAADRTDCREHVAGPLPRGASSCTTSSTCGITSPARWIVTVSPTRTSSRSISSSLCSVALRTTTPPTVTGCSLATGVSAPVRPTWISIASTTRRRPLGREFVRDRPARDCARRSRAGVAERGRRPCRRRRRCRSRASRAAPRSRGNARAAPRRCRRLASAD